MLSIDRSNVVLGACKAQENERQFLLQQILHVVLTVEEPTESSCFGGHERLAVSITLICTVNMMEKKQPRARLCS